MTMGKLLGIGAVLVIALAGGSALAEGDAAMGEKVFKKCKACHTIADGGRNKVGPNLFGIVGRKAGSAPKYKYSKSYVAAGENGLTWNEDDLLEYLSDPKKYLRKITGNPKARSKMAFKLKKEKDRENVVAYLKEQK